MQKNKAKKSSATKPQAAQADNPPLCVLYNAETKKVVAGEDVTVKFFVDNKGRAFPEYPYDVITYNYPIFQDLKGLAQKIVGCRVDGVKKKQLTT